MTKDLAVFSKKFEDAYDFLLVYNAFYPHASACTQPGSANDVDDSTSSGNAAHDDDASRRNKDTPERLV